MIDSILKCYGYTGESDSLQERNFNLKDYIKIMIISAFALQIIVIVAVAVSAIAPIVLLILFLKDLFRGELW